MEVEREFLELDGSSYCITKRRLFTHCSHAWGRHGRRVDGDVLGLPQTNCETVPLHLYCFLHYSNIFTLSLLQFIIISVFCGGE